MTIFESLETAHAINKQSFEIAMYLPSLKGADGKKMEEVRAMMLKKRSDEVNTWGKITRIYPPGS